MAGGKTTKKTIKKPIKKNVKASANKHPLKTKPKATKKTKKAAKKPITKKTYLKIKPKPSKTRKPASKKPGAKKLPLKIKTRTVPQSIRVKTSVSKPAIKQAEDEKNAALRKALIAKRESIVQEARAEISKYIKGETRQLVDTALDDGDWSVIDLSEDISFKQLSTHRENLQKIDETLRKLVEGTYGICEDCGDEISEKRLKILPFAIYCIDCQEKREQLEEMERMQGFTG
jgi:DnaK suppressor protein